jgi:hypothetical protein
MQQYAALDFGADKTATSGTFTIQFFQHLLQQQLF